MFSKQLHALFAALFFCGTLFAQEESGSAKEEKSYGQFSAGYMNDFVYLGRKDSLRMPYLTPQLGYYHKSGLFATASLSYLSSQSRVDMYTFGLGFERDFTKKINAGWWLEKYVYNNSSTNVIAEIKAMSGVYGSYDFGPVAAGVNTWLSFADKNDIALGFNLKHAFQTKNEKWEITPKAEMNAATQNFYKSYYENRRVRRRLPNGNIITIPVQIDEAARFRILEYNLGTEIKFTTGRFEFTVNPTFYIPANPAVITIGNKKITEQLENSFVGEVGVAVSF